MCRTIGLVMLVATQLLAACGDETDPTESMFGLPGSPIIPNLPNFPNLFSPGSTGQSGLPADFPQLVDSGGMGQGQVMPSWGGDPSMSQAQNRAALKHTPVILVHGNGASAYGNATWSFLWDLSWTDMVNHLKAKGYVSSEIWAVSYLGKDPIMAQLQNPYSTNIDDVRAFIDAVRAYLGVQKVDIISHSLGVQLAKGYMTGLQNTGTWDYTQHRLDAVGTLVGLSGANYGFGHQFDMYASIVGEMCTGQPFEQGSHLFEGVVDDTPWGPTLADQKTGGTVFDSASWSDKDYRGTTSLDNGKVTYVALWHEEDQIDKYNDKSGRLWGANLNHGVSGLDSDALQAHIKMIHDPGVFDLFFPYLNRVGVVPGKVTPPPKWTCKETADTTYGHVVAGRASSCGVLHACAKGSNDDLGLVSLLTSVTLAETSSGFFKKGSCP